MAKHNFNALIYNIHDPQFKQFAKKYLKGDLIDIGCGIKPYKELISPFINNHIGLDHEITFHDKSNIDIYGSAYNIPASDNSFDSAICTAVLEHLEEPELAIRECFRILKGGSYAIYSVPFIWHLHEEPRDFYRYSKYGLKYLFEKAGFEIVEIKPLSGFIVTFSQLFIYYIRRFNIGLLKWFRIIELLSLIIQKVAFLLNKVDNSFGWTWMYIVVVRKKNES